MITVTVEFYGICTHFFGEVHDELQVPHRVVLVHADRNTEVRSIPIGPHLANLRLNDRSWRLDGVHLSLEMPPGEEAPGFARHPSLPDLPTLADLMGGLEPLSRPSPIVFGSPAGQVACYFDISVGTLWGHRTESDAAFSRLVAETDGHFVLKATPFDGAALPQGLQPETILTEDTTIVVANLDDSAGEKPAADFLLHYKTAEQLPTVPQIPQVQTLRAVSLTVQPTQRTIGAGCSNSNYP